MRRHTFAANQLPLSISSVGNKCLYATPTGCRRSTLLRRFRNAPAASCSPSTPARCCTSMVPARRCKNGLRTLAPYLYFLPFCINKGTLPVCENVTLNQKPNSTIAQHSRHHVGHGKGLAYYLGRSFKQNFRKCDTCHVLPRAKCDGSHIYGSFGCAVAFGCAAALHLRQRLYAAKEANRSKSRIR